MQCKGNHTGIDASKAPPELHRSLQPHLRGLCLKCWHYPFACHSLVRSVYPLPTGQVLLWAAQEGERRWADRREHGGREALHQERERTGWGGLGSAFTTCVTLDMGLKLREPHPKMEPVMLYLWDCSEN